MQASAWVTRRTLSRLGRRPSSAEDVGRSQLGRALSSARPTPGTGPSLCSAESLSPPQKILGKPVSFVAGSIAAAATGVAGTCPTSAVARNLAARDRAHWGTMTKTDADRFPRTPCSSTRPVCAPISDFVVHDGRDVLLEFRFTPLAVNRFLAGKRLCATAKSSASRRTLQGLLRDCLSQRCVPGLSF